MPTPEATDPKFWEDFWGWLLAAGGGLVVAVRTITKRRKAATAEGEPAWVDRVIDALGEVRETVRAVNEATTENIRQVLTLYGKDVTEIRSAQERMERHLAEMREQLSDLRVELARRNGNGAK